MGDGRLPLSFLPKTLPNISNDVPPGPSHGGTVEAPAQQREREESDQWESYDAPPSELPKFTVEPVGGMGRSSTVGVDASGILSGSGMSNPRMSRRVSTPFNRAHTGLLVQMGVRSKEDVRGVKLDLAYYFSALIYPALPALVCLSFICIGHYGGDRIYTITVVPFWYLLELMMVVFPIWTLYPEQFRLEIVVLLVGYVWFLICAVELGVVFIAKDRDLGWSLGYTVDKIFGVIGLPTIFALSLWWSRRALTKDILETRNRKRQENDLRDNSELTIKGMLNIRKMAKAARHQRNSLLSSDGEDESEYDAMTEDGTASNVGSLGRRSTVGRGRASTYIIPYETPVPMLFGRNPERDMEKRRESHLQAAYGVDINMAVGNHGDAWDLGVSGLGEGTENQTVPEDTDGHGPKNSITAASDRSEWDIVEDESHSRRQRGWTAGEDSVTPTGGILRTSRLASTPRRKTSFDPSLPEDLPSSGAADSGSKGLSNLSPYSIYRRMTAVSAASTEATEIEENGNPESVTVLMISLFSVIVMVVLSWLVRSFDGIYGTFAEYAGYMLWLLVPLLVIIVKDASRNFLFSYSYLFFYVSMAGFIPQFLGHTCLRYFIAARGVKVIQLSVMCCYIGIYFLYLNAVLYPVIARMTAPCLYARFAFIGQVYYTFYYYLAFFNVNFNALYVGMIILCQVHYVCTNTGLYFDMLGYVLIKLRAFRLYHAIIGKASFLSLQHFIKLSGQEVLSDTIALITVPSIITAFVLLGNDHFHVVNLLTIMWGKYLVMFVCRCASGAVTRRIFIWKLNRFKKTENFSTLFGADHDNRIDELVHRLNLDGMSNADVSSAPEEASSSQNSATGRMPGMQALKDMVEKRRASMWLKNMIQSHQLPQTVRVANLLVKDLGYVTKSYDLKSYKLWMDSAFRNIDYPARYAFMDGYQFDNPQQSL